MELQENKNDDLIELIIKFLSGNLSEEEYSQLQLLLNNTENQKIFEEMSLSWKASGVALSDYSVINPNKSWNKIKESIENSDDSFHKTNKFRIGIAKLVRTAAIWILLISLSSVITWMVIKSSLPKENSSVCTINTPMGSKAHIILPDGTEVWLNAGTSLKYPEKFSTSQRDIFLTGEAFFKVVSNKKWPFVVHTTELNIKALGTSFNVKAYPGEKFVTTTLVEGIVKLENTKRNFHYTLQPKQELVFKKEPDNATDEAKLPDVKKVTETDNNSEVNKDAVIKTDVNTTVSVSWKDKRWIINGEIIENLTVMLERRYDMKVNILSEELKPYKFSGTIENETLEQVLEYLKYTIPVKYKFNKGSVDLILDSAMKERNEAFLKQQK